MWNATERLNNGAERRHYARGTFMDVRMPWSVNVGAAAVCPDGVTRKLSRTAATADTFFSIPASVQVRRNGRRYTVAGYVTFNTADGSDVATADNPAHLEFRPYLYRKNHDVFNVEGGR